MGERDDDAVAGADEALELVLRLGDPARGDRGALRLERDAAGPAGTGRARSRRRGRAAESLLLPDAADVVRLPDEVGRAVDGRDEVGRRLRRRGVGLVGRGRLDEVAAPLGGGVDAASGRRCERALRERREGAHLLDLVAEELDAKRLAAGGREDVDDPAADGELPALVDAVDPLVARERELLGEPVDARLVADAEVDGSGSRLERRQALGERARRRADEPARGEHVERAVALADEMWRRLEPRLVADAAAGKERDAARAPRNQPAASAASRASASSGRRTSSPRPSSSCSAASTSGKTGSETRARVGRACANAWKRS